MSGDQPSDVADRQQPDNVIVGQDQCSIELTLLKVADKTVYTMAQKGQLPAFKVRGQWRFRREDINRWIDQQQAKKAAGGSDE